MPYLKASEVDRLTLPSDPDYWVEMKRTASYGDKLAAQEAMLRVSHVDLDAVPGEKVHLVQGGSEAGRGVLTETETGAYFRTLLVRLITAWNLTDGGDRPLPVDEASVELLDSADGEFLQAAA